jgi:hypothetical protein
VGGERGGEISKQEYNPGKMTKPKGMGRIVITFRLGRFFRTRGQKLALVQDTLFCVLLDMKHYRHQNINNYIENNPS